MTMVVRFLGSSQSIVYALCLYLITEQLKAP
jgi:hypothetical protein